MATKQDLKLRRDRLAQAERTLQKRRETLAGLGANARELGEQARSDLQHQLDRNVRDLERIDDMTTSTLMAPWTLEAWGGWQPNPTALPVWLRVGGYRERRSGALLPVPATIPFIGSGQALTIVSGGTTSAAGDTGPALLSSLLLRIAAALAGRARIVSVDPSYSDPVSNADVELEELVREIQRRTRLYLDDTHPDLEAVPIERRASDPYIIVAAPTFPTRYDERARRQIATIARSGPAVGIYLIAQADHLRDVETWPSALVNLDAGEQLLSGLPVDIEFDRAPDTGVRNLVLERLRSVVPHSRATTWDDVAGLAHDDWWEESADERLAAPIGFDDNGVPAAMWFGSESATRRSCVHGLIVSMPGAGRTALLHSLICGLAIRYSPEELNLCLIDGPNGFDFLPFRQLPHAAIVSVRTAPDFARGIIDELLGELERREALLASSGTADFTSYRRRGQPSGVLPRVLTIIDDIDLLMPPSSEALLRLARQGRAVGMHLLLGMQRVSNSPDLFATMHLRIAMQLAQPEIATLTEFGAAGRRLISQHNDRAGAFVLNDSAGDDAANTAGRVGFLPPTRRDSLVRELAHRAELRPGLRLPDRLVNDGAESPRLRDNTWVAELLANASDELRAGGATVVSGWIGREVSPRGHTRLDLHRGPAENVAFVGAAEADRVAMLASFVLTAALSSSAHDLTIWVGDSTTPSGSAATTLPYVVAGLNTAGYPTRIARAQADVARLVRDAISQLDHRIGLDDASRAAQSTMLVVLNEPDRVSALQRVPDEFGMVDSPLSLGLRRLLTQGPTLGIHVIFSSVALPLLHAVVAERAVQQLIRARVALRMNDDDSYAFVRSADAAELVADGGATAVSRAVAFDSLRAVSTLFAPYRADSLFDEFDTILTALRARVSDRSVTES